MKKTFTALCGILVGIINGTVGAGGGLLAVPMLKKSGLNQKQSHSTAVAVLLPICFVSALSYLFARHVTLSDASPYFLPSALGAVAGTVALKFIPTGHLKRIFAIFMLWAGVRLFLR